MSERHPKEKPNRADEANPRSPSPPVPPAADDERAARTSTRRLKAPSTKNTRRLVPAPPMVAPADAATPETSASATSSPRPITLPPVEPDPEPVEPEANAPLTPVSAPSAPSSEAQPESPREAQTESPREAESVRMIELECDSDEPTELNHRPASRRIQRSPRRAADTSRRFAPASADANDDDDDEIDMESASDSSAALVAAKAESASPRSPAGAAEECNSSESDESDEVEVEMDTQVRLPVAPPVAVAVSAPLPLPSTPAAVSAPPMMLSPLDRLASDEFETAEWDSGKVSVTNFLSQTIGVSSDVDLPGRSAIFDALRERLSDTNPESRYVIASEIARGGMGSIHVLFDKDIRREVAMKVILGGRDAPRDKQARFLEEAQITGQLEHPNIVPVHELGIDGTGSLYFTMKLVRGESLLEVIENTRDAKHGHDKHFTLARLLQIFLKICDAVSFAHAKGVIHRDLKPENVMVGDYGEVLVMDWGLSKVMGRPDHTRERFVITDRFEDGVVKTLDGSIVGTPGHMPPEQANGEIDNLDERSDIYALGCILYEILTFEPPFPGNDVERLIKAVRRGRFIPPSRRAPWRTIPRELEEVVMKSMAYEKPDRYQSVQELKNEIEAFLEGRTLASVHYTAPQLFVKWVRRHLGATVVGLISFVMLSIVAVYSVAAMSAERHATHAELARLRKDQESAANDPARLAAHAKTLREHRLVADGEAALERGDVAMAKQIVAHLQALGKVPSLASKLLAERLRVVDGMPLEPLPIGSQVRCMAYDPATERLIVGASEHRLLLVNLSQSSRDMTVPAMLRPADITAVGVGARSLLVTGDTRGIVTGIGPSDAERWSFQASDGPIQALQITNEWIYAVDDRGRLIAWRIRDQARSGSIAVEPVTALAVAPSMIAVGAASGRVQLIVTNTNPPTTIAFSHAIDAVRDVVFDADAMRLAVRSGGTVGVYDILHEPPNLMVRMRYRLDRADGSNGIWLDEREDLWIGTADGLECRDLASGVLRARHTFARPPRSAASRADRAVFAPIVRLTATRRGLIAVDANGNLHGLTDRHLKGGRIVTTGLFAVTDFAISPSGDRLVAIDGTHLVEMRAGDAYRPILRPVPRPPLSVAFTASDRLFLLTADGAVWIDRAETAEDGLGVEAWEPLRTEAVGLKRILGAPDASALTLVSSSGAITHARVVIPDNGAATMRPMATMPMVEGVDEVPAVAHLTPTLVARADAPGRWQIIDLSRPAVTDRIDLPRATSPASDSLPRVTALASAADGRWVLVGDDRGYLHGFGAPAEAGERWMARFSVAVSTVPIRTIAVAATRPLVAIGDTAGDVRMWRLDLDSPRDLEFVGQLTPPGTPHGAVSFGFASDRLWYPLQGFGCPIRPFPLAPLFE